MQLPLQLNTRTKILLLLFANIMVFYHLPLTQELISLGFLLLIIFLSGQHRRGFIYLALFASALLIDATLPILPDNFFTLILFFYANAFRRLMPLLMLGGYFMATTKVSDLIYTLRTWHVPTFIVIPLSVLFRFFPTLRTDYQQIRAAMRLRGIAMTNLDMLKQPVQTLEYILMPLLMSATNTAVDLSAASLTKGITAPGHHTSIYARKLAVTDYLIILAGVLITILRGVK